MLFCPGDTGFLVVEWQGVKIGMMICFDWIFPESARTLALRGAQIIAHPANLVSALLPERYGHPFNRKPGIHGHSQSGRQGKPGKPKPHLHRPISGHYPCRQDPLPGAHQQRDRPHC